MRFGMAQNINPRGVTFALAERRLLIEMGEQVEKKLMNSGKPLGTEKPNHLEGHIATEQGGIASKHLVGLPKEKPSQMLSIMGEAVAKGDT